MILPQWEFVGFYSFKLRTPTTPAPSRTQPDIWINRASFFIQTILSELSMFSSSSLRQELFMLQSLDQQKPLFSLSPTPVSKGKLTINATQWYQETPTSPDVLVHTNSKVKTVGRAPRNCVSVIWNIYNFPEREEIIVLIKPSRGGNATLWLNWYQL